MSPIRLHFCILIPALIFIIIFSACIKRVDRPAKIDYNRYFPLNEGDWRQFSGPFGRSSVNEQTNNIFTFTYYDTLGNIIGWKDFIRGESGIYLNNIIVNANDVPAVFFEPALRFLPWNNIIGDTLFQTATEISLDSVYTHSNITVEYEIIKIDTVLTPAGKFTDCVAVQMNYSASNRTKNKSLAGVTTWWFAYDVGIVKYVALGGDGVLLQANIDGVSYPFK